MTHGAEVSRLGTVGHDAKVGGPCRCVSVWRRCGASLGAIDLGIELDALAHNVERRTVILCLVSAKALSFVVSPLPPLSPHSVLPSPIS